MWAWSETWHLFVSSIILLMWERNKERKRLDIDSDQRLATNLLFAPAILLLVWLVMISCLVLLFIIICLYWYFSVYNSMVHYLVEYIFAKWVFAEHLCFFFELTSLRSRVGYGLTTFFALISLECKCS